MDRDMDPVVTDPDPDRLPTTPAALRASMPALDGDAVYMNTGATGPATEPVLTATADFLRYHEATAPTGAGGYEVAFETYERVRDRVAAFLGTSTDAIALTQSTADGIARVAASIDWTPGDVVVHTDLEHPAGRLPWWNLERQGVDVEVLETTAGRLDRDAVKTAVADARLLCFNSITWSHGTRLPVADLVEIAHDADTLVLVDAVQSPGQTPVDVTEWGADFVVGAGHKWLLGPWGAGFLYVCPDLAETMAPAAVGYRSVTDPDADRPTFKPGARRFEVGTTNPAPHVGLARAMAVSEAVGLSTIETRIATLTDRLKAGLGDRLLSPREYESGLVTFTVEDEAPTAVVDRLRETGVIVRSLPYPEAVRASIHAFNTAEDVDALLAALPR